MPRVCVPPGMLCRSFAVLWEPLPKRHTDHNHTFYDSHSFTSFPYHRTTPDVTVVFMQQGRIIDEEV